jgi:replicative DNA helicase
MKTDIKEADPAQLAEQGLLPAHPEELPATPFVDPESIDLDKEAPTVGAMAAEAFERMRRRARGEEKPTEFPWPTVNQALSGGLWPGLHIVVGNTGAGKSQWALQTALHAAHTGTPVLYVGLELGKVDLIARLIGLMDGQRWSRLWLGEARDNKNPVDELDALENKYGPALSALPFHLAFAKPYGWSYELLHPFAEALKKRYRTQLVDAEGKNRRAFLVVLDFLQLVSGPESRPQQELRERIQQASYAGRAIARDMDATVLFISGTSRENYRLLDGKPLEKGSGKEEKLGEGNPSRLVGLGKESGEVEYAADSVLALCREPWPASGEPSDGTHIWLAIAKTRARGDSPEARRGWVELRFNGGWFTEPNSAIRTYRI